MSEAVAELPAPGQSLELFLAGPAGRLETQLAAPREAAVGICVVCHPHPLYGGAMSNKVVYTLASAALKAGLLTARFNFRGVGRSEGAYDAARGETDDTLAVVDWLRQRLPALPTRGPSEARWAREGAHAPAPAPTLGDAVSLAPPLLLAGFSFGAYVSLKAAARARPALLVSASIPFGKYVDAAEPPPHPGCPWLAVHSVDDEVVEFETTRRVLEAYAPPPQLVRLEGAGHFYHGRLGELQQAVQPFLQEHLAS